MLSKIYKNMNKLFKLSFENSTMESKFQKNYIKTNLIQNRIAVIISLFAYLIYVPVAMFITPSEYHIAIYLLLYLIVPVTLFFLWITTKKHFFRFPLHYMLFTIILLGSGPVFVLHFTHDYYQEVYTLFILPIIAIFVMFSAPFVISLMGVTILIISFFVTAIFIHLSYTDTIFATYLILTAFVLSVISAYMTEKSKRKIYYASLLQEQLNNRLIEVQEVAGIGFWEFDIKKNHLYWSDDVYTIFGLVPQEFTATYEDFLHYVHPDDREELNSEYQKSIQEKRTYSITHKVVQKSGDIRHVEEHCKHTFDENGEPIKSIGTVHDITDRINDQHKLQKLFDLQENILIQTDGKNLKKVNQSFLNFFGYASIEDFLIHCNCICERFIQHEKYFHLGKVPEGKTWLDMLKIMPKIEQTVTMVNKEMETHAFRISFNYFDDEDYIISFTDISETMVEQFSLENRLKYDNLTKAYSRDYFDNNIAAITEKAKSSSNKLGVVMFDIDLFKNVNDTYGHDVGDYVLKHLVATVHDKIRKDDKLIRWGGEEFLLIVEVDSIDTLYNIIESLRQTIEDEKFDNAGALTCSFGIAIHSESRSIHQTIKEADTALYNSKESGRNRVTIS